MRGFVRASSGVLATFAVLSVMAAPAGAAGALAIGQCAAYGYAYDFPSVNTAQQAAIAKCDGACKQVVTTQKGCVAFAVDGRKPCGAHGYANATKLGMAENSALKQCYRYGGKDCMIRAWICDGRKS
jgi:hypothetical protein